MESMEMLEKVEKLALSKGYRPASLERMVGLPKDRISKVKRTDSQEFRAEELLRIARFLGVRIEFFIEPEASNPDDYMQSPQEGTLLSLVGKLDGGIQQAIEVIGDLLKAEQMTPILPPPPPHSPVDPGWSKPLGQRTIKRSVSSPVPSGKGMAGKQPK